MDLLQLAASVPGILGYDPAGSVVLVALSDGPPSAVRFTVRVDEPPHGRSREIADELAAIMGRHRVSHAAVCGYAALGDLTAIGPALAVVTDTLEAAGVCIVGTVTVDGARVREHGETRGGWVSLPDAVITGGDQPRSALAAGVEAGPLAAEVEAAAASGRGTSPVRDVFEAWGRVLGVLEGDPAPVDYATAALGVEESSVRDTVVAWACPGTLPLECLPAELQEEVRQVLPSTPPWREGEGREAARERLYGRLWALCQSLPDPLIPQAGAVAASILWDAGDGSRARMVLDRVQRVQPDHSLAALMTRCLDYGIRTRG